jgi:hypothetical protein
MKSKVENAIELVKNSPASLFTKEDVIKLLNEVSDVPTDDQDSEDNDKATITEDQMNELIDDNTVTTVVSFNLTHTHNERYSAILIYR